MGIYYYVAILYVIFFRSLSSPFCLVSSLIISLSQPHLQELKMQNKMKCICYSLPSAPAPLLSFLPLILTPLFSQHIFISCPSSSSPTFSTSFTSYFLFSPRLFSYFLSPYRVHSSLPEADALQILSFRRRLRFKFMWKTSYLFSIRYFASQLANLPKAHE